MPSVTDPYNQGVAWLDYTENPDLRAMGDAIALPLTERSNMRFASAAERDSFITNPMPGMKAYLESEDEFTGYTSGGWQVIAAGSAAWTQPSLASGFAHNGNSQGNFRYRRVNLAGVLMVFLSGSITPTYGPSIPNGGDFLNSALPTSARPSGTRTVVIPASNTGSVDGYLKLDARTDGQLRVTGTNTSDRRPEWIGFHGVSYAL